MYVCRQSKNEEQWKTEYSKVLEYSVLKNVFNEEYFDTYFEINYIEEISSVKDINTLLDLGYTSNEINIFYEKVPNSINVITENSYNKDITNYITLDYFNEENLDRYIKYDNNENKLDSIYNTDIINDNYTYEDTVTFVNAYLDKDYYTNDINLTNEEANNLDVIVNKYYKLNSDYEPSDLTKINSKYSSGSNQRLRKEATSKFEEMASAMRNEDLKIYAGSTYRSYDYQLGLYNRYVAQDGFAEAETYSARAGYSEHQLGLAVDILNGRWSYLSETDKEYEWLINNSYKYGYILRYPRNKEYVTGYVFEDWHFRYLGIELATKVYENAAKERQEAESNNNEETTEEDNKKLAEEYKDEDIFYCLGSGPNFGLSFKLAMTMLMEGAIKHACPEYSAEFRHGLIERAEKDVPIIILRSDFESDEITDKAIEKVDKKVKYDIIANNATTITPSTIIPSQPLMSTKWLQTKPRAIVIIKQGIALK